MVQKEQLSKISTIAKVVYVAIEMILIMLTVALVGWFEVGLILMYEEAFSSNIIFSGFMLLAFVFVGFCIYSNLRMIVYETIFMIADLITKKVTFKEAVHNFRVNASQYNLSIIWYDRCTNEEKEIKGD